MPAANGGGSEVASVEEGLGVLLEPSENGVGGVPAVRDEGSGCGGGR